MEMVEARCVELLGAIFYGNALLCRRAPPRVYSVVARLLGSDDEHPEGASRRRLLRVFQVSNATDPRLCSLGA